MRVGASCLGAFVGVNERIANSPDTMPPCTATEHARHIVYASHLRFIELLAIASPAS
jgi:hypothetical protein